MLNPAVRQTGDHHHPGVPGSCEKIHKEIGEKEIGEMVDLSDKLQVILSQCSGDERYPGIVDQNVKFSFCLTKFPGKLSTLSEDQI